MSIGSVNRTRRVATATVRTPANLPASEHRDAAPVEPLDDSTEKPLPQRPAWLDRVALRLEAAAHQPAAFAPTPVLGARLDQSA